MPCPVCKMPLGPDHRQCLVELFRTNKIQTVKDWEDMMKPKTIIKGKARIRIEKE